MKQFRAQSSSWSWVDSPVLTDVIFTPSHQASLGGFAIRTQHLYGHKPGLTSAKRHQPSTNSAQADAMPWDALPTGFPRMVHAAKQATTSTMSSLTLESVSQSPTKQQTTTTNNRNISTPKPNKKIKSDKINSCHTSTTSRNPTSQAVSTLGYPPSCCPRCLVAVPPGVPRLQRPRQRGRWSAAPRTARRFRAAEALQGLQAVPGLLGAEDMVTQGVGW